VGGYLRCCDVVQGGYERILVIGGIPRKLRSRLRSLIGDGNLSSRIAAVLRINLPSTVAVRLLIDGWSTGFSANTKLSTYTYTPGTAASGTAKPTTPLPIPFPFP
jgi:hypothetical protein